MPNILFIFALIPSFILVDLYSYIYVKQLVFQCLVIVATGSLLHSRKINALSIGFFIFALLNIYSVFYSEIALASWHRSVDLLFIGLWIAIVSVLKFSAINIKHIIYAIILGGVLTALMGLGFLYYHNLNRLMWPLGNPNIFGAYLIAPIICVVFQLYNIKNINTSKIQYVLYVVALLVLSFAFAKCRSQSSSLAFVLSSIIFALAYITRHKKNIFYIILLLLIVFAVLLSLNESVLNYLRVSQAVRYTTIQTALSLCKNAPLLGHGAGSYIGLFNSFAPADWYLLPGFGLILNTAHNEYAQLLGSLGIVGLSVFLAIILLPLFLFYRHPVKTAIPICLIHLAWVFSIGLSGAMRYEFFPIVFWTNYAILLSIVGDNFVVNIRYVKLKQLILIPVICLCIYLVIRSGVAHYHYYQGQRLASLGKLQQAVKSLELSKNKLNSLHKESFLRWRLFGLYRQLHQESQALSIANELEQISPHYVNISKIVPQMGLNTQNLSAKLVPLLTEMFRDYHDYFYRDSIASLVAQSDDINKLLLHFTKSQQLFIKIMVARTYPQDLIINLLKCADKPKATDMLIADTNLKYGYVNKAIKAYVKHAELYPYSSQGWVGLLKVALFTKNNNKANQLLDKIYQTELEKFNEPLKYFLAKTSLRLHRWQYAYNLYKQFLKKGDTRPDVILGIAQASLFLGNHQEAHAHIAQLNKRYKSILTKKQQALANLILKY